MRCELCGEGFRDADRLTRHYKQHGVNIPEISEEFAQEMEEVVRQFTRDMSHLCLQEGVEDVMAVMLLTAFQQILALTISQEEDIVTFVESLEHATKSAVEEGVLKPSR